MKIEPFKLERYFARYEFNIRYLLSSSDCESLSMAELLALASPASQALWQELRLGYTESPGHVTRRVSSRVCSPAYLEYFRSAESPGKY